MGIFTRPATDTNIGLESVATDTQTTEAPAQEASATETQEETQGADATPPVQEEVPAQEADAEQKKSVSEEGETQETTVPTAEDSTPEQNTGDQTQEENLELNTGLEQNAGLDVTGDISLGTTTPNAKVTRADSGSVATQRSAANGAYALMNAGIVSDRLARRSENLRDSLRDVRMVQAVTQVAVDHAFSSPMVAALHAIPGFTQVVQNFPGVDRFSVCLEPTTSINAIAGMESFTAAADTTADQMKAKAADVVSAFGDSLTNLGPVVNNLRTQIDADKETLSANDDITEDVLATLQVNALEDTNFTQLLTQTETYLQVVRPFDFDQLQAHPEKVTDEVAGLQQVVSEVGSVFGFTLDSTGLRNTDRDTAFEASLGTFGEKNIDGASINLMVSRASAILDQLDAVAQRKDEIVTSLNVAVESMPTALDTDDVTYGALDHTTLIGSYVTFTNKLVSEGIQAVALVLSTVNSILDIPTASAE